MIKLTISGDFSPNEEACKISEDAYSENFGFAKKLFDSSDYNIINLEAPVVDGILTPIRKTGPNKHTKDSAIDILSYMGINAVCLANNHFFDHGQNGVEQTLQSLAKHNITYVGGGDTLASSQKTLIIEIKGKRIAIINCCEHESSLATTSHGGSNPINPISQYYAISQAKAVSDYIIVIAHGGIEHFKYPTPRMQSLYRYYVDCGANAVINHHQHCYSGFEYHNGSPIIYGLGNFFFPKKSHVNDFWNYGYSITLNIENNIITFDCHPYCQCLNKNFMIQELTCDKLDEFRSNIAEINNVISNPALLLEKYDEYLNKTKSSYASIFTPYHSNFLEKLCARGILPKFYNKNKLRRIASFIKCESHQERLLNFIDSLIQNNK